MVAVRIRAGQNENSLIRRRNFRWQWFRASKKVRNFRMGFQYANIMSESQMIADGSSRWFRNVLATRLTEDGVFNLLQKAQTEFSQGCGDVLAGQLQLGMVSTKVSQNMKDAKGEGGRVSTLGADKRVRNQLEGNRVHSTRVEKERNFGLVWGKYKNLKLIRVGTFIHIRCHHAYKFKYLKSQLRIISLIELAH